MNKYWARHWMHIHWESGRNSTLPSCTAVHESCSMLLNAECDRQLYQLFFAAPQHAACSLPRLVCLHAKHGMAGMHGTNGTRFGTPGDRLEAVCCYSGLEEDNGASDMARGLFAVIRSQL